MSPKLLVRRVSTLGFFALVSVGIWFLVFTYASSVRCDEKRLCVAFLDVGQGDAIFIQSPSGMQMLVDGGRDRSVLRRLSEVMQSRDWSIDYVVSTHADADHITGLVDILTRYAVSFVVATERTGDTDIARRFREASNASSAEKIVPFAGDVYDLGAGVAVTVLYPSEDVSKMDTNNASVVLHVRYGMADFILTGDAPLASEYTIAKNFGDTIQAEVLKAGHHGSHTSSGMYFLKRVQPAIAVISAGKDNSYGHPHKDVVQRFADTGTAVVNTADNGTVIFETDGETIAGRNIKK